MRRRDFVLSSLGLSAAWHFPGFAQSNPLADLLGQLEADPTLVENSWVLRESTKSRGVGTGRRSNRAISRQAIEMVIAFEVASPAVYERKWRRPIWPKGQSGVTIGVGYDLRYANRAFLERDWPMLTPIDRATLYPVLGLSGLRARDALPQVQNVVIPWTPARDQFLKFLPYPTAQAEDAFPNTRLLNADSFGALVSLVYNRGPAMPRNSNKRREMLEIRDLMQRRDFAAIPGRIRAMKRLWPDPDSRGLIIRREAEAVLFETGLRA